MYCNHCGTQIEDNAAFCPNCGTTTRPEPAAEPVAAPAPVTYKPTEITPDMLPEQYRPLSPWAYFGLQILFSIPIVGLIFLIIFSCKRSNYNRRNFARSYWCGLILIAVLLLLVILIGGLGAARYVFNY